MAEQTKPVYAFDVIQDDAREAGYERDRTVGTRRSLEARVESRVAYDAFVELTVAVAALVDPPLRYNGDRIEIDCSDHATAMAVVGRVRKALAAVRGGASE